MSSVWSAARIENSIHISTLSMISYAFPFECEIMRLFIAAETVTVAACRYRFECFFLLVLRLSVDAHCTGTHSWKFVRIEMVEIQSNYRYCFVNRHRTVHRNRR